jgi:Fe-S cluster biogenesis protein NfuA
MTTSCTRALYGRVPVVRIIDGELWAVPEHRRPRRSPRVGETGQLIDDEERAARQAALDQLMELMRPAVQADGGDLVVTDVDFDAGIVDVELQGACGSCAISGLTLQGGVERLMRQRLPWVTEVRGSVDESMDVVESSSLGRGGYVPRSR